MKGMYICNRFSVEQRRMIKFIESIENWQRIDDLSSYNELAKPFRDSPLSIQVVKYYLKFLQRRVWSWLRMNASGKPNTCKSNGNFWCLHRKTSGERVRNAYAICLLLGYSPEKFGLIPYNII